MKSLQKSKIYYYDPQSPGMNVQLPQSESTSRKLTSPAPPVLIQLQCFGTIHCLVNLQHPPNLSLQSAESEMLYQSKAVLSKIEIV